MPKITYIYSSDEIQQTGYACIVEGWDKVKSQGSKQRRYRAEFSKEDRKKLSQLYRNKLYPWYLRTGIPPEVTMPRTTFGLIERAAGFFASL